MVQPLRLAYDSTFGSCGIAQALAEKLFFVQPLRRFAPAPLVGEPLASRWWLYWTNKVFCNREQLGSAVLIHGCLPYTPCQSVVPQLLSIRTAGLTRPAKGRPPSVAIRDISLRPEGVFPARGAGERKRD